MPGGSFFSRAPRRPSLAAISEDGDIIADDQGPADAQRAPPAYRRYIKGRLSGTDGNRANMPPPPSYMPALHLSAQGQKRNATGLAMNGVVLRGQDGQVMNEKVEGKTGSKRRRWIIIAVLLVLLVGLIIGLAVGLTVGKDKGKDDNSSDSSDSDSNTVDQVYPAGSYTFDTTLQQDTTACTSNPSTWRCSPYELGGGLMLSWVITALNASTFNISSTDNVFAPRFANQTSTLLDAGAANERLTFEVTMDRTVVPDSSLTSDNRAARCTFSDTKFGATLWTRRNGNKTIEPPEGKANNKFDKWPGGVEVTQRVGATDGSPSCEDTSGNAITGVKAGSGECLCGYASFDLE